MNFSNIERVVDRIARKTVKEFLAQDESQWITVHPGGKGPKSDGSGDRKGTPVLIDKDTGKILGGMGGKFKGKKISEIRKSFVGPQTPEKLPTEMSRGKKTIRKISQADRKTFLQYATVDEQDKYNHLLRKRGNYSSLSNEYKELDKQIRTLVSDFVDEYNKKQREKYIKNSTHGNVFTPEMLAHRQKIAPANMYPSTIAGQACGNPMTPAQADSNHPNPNYGNGDEGYKQNCQSCVVCYEARLRGYNVSTKRREVGDASNPLEKLAHQSQNAWIDPKTGSTPELLIPKKIKTNAKEYVHFLEETIESGKRYNLQYVWRESGRNGKYRGHVVSISRNQDGNVEVYDPQCGSKFSGTALVSYCKNMSFQLKSGRYLKWDKPPHLYRVDNMAFNPEFMNDIMTFGG